MEFLGIGLPELVVILALILIVVGPARLPELAAQLARFVRTARKLSSEVTKEFNTTMSELEQEYDDMKGEWKEIGQGIEDTTKEVTGEIDAASTDARKALGDAKTAAEGTPAAAADETAKPSPPAS